MLLILDLSNKISIIQNIRKEWNCFSLIIVQSFDCLWIAEIRFKSAPIVLRQVVFLWRTLLKRMEKRFKELYIPMKSIITSRYMAFWKTWNWKKTKFQRNYKIFFLISWKKFRTFIFWQNFKKYRKKTWYIFHLKSKWLRRNLHVFTCHWRIMQKI